MVFRDSMGRPPFCLPDLSPIWFITNIQMVRHFQVSYLFSHCFSLILLIESIISQSPSQIKIVIKSFSNSPFFNYVMNTFRIFTMCYSLFHKLNPPANKSQILSHPHFIDKETQAQKVTFLEVM